MKTLKKTLCLVLAVVMVVGVLVLPANAATTTAADAEATAAFNTLNEYGVMYGVDANNTPALNRNINRQDMAAIIYRVMTGDTTDTYVGNYVGSAAKFADSATFATWAKGYIGYVREREIFMGDNNGNFKPTEEIKGSDVLTVLLRCIGYGKNGEFTGAGYAEAAQTQAAQIHMFGGATGYKDVKADMSKVINRGVVAKLVYNAVKAPMVTYLNGNYSPYTSYGLPVAPNTPGAQTNPSLISYKDNADPKTHTQYGIEATRIYPTATFNSPVSAVTKYLPTDVRYEAPVKEYWTAVTHCQVAQDLGFPSTLTIDTVYTNGAQNTTSVTLNATNTQATIGAQGRHTLFFDRDPYDTRPADTIVYIDTLLAKVDNVTPASFDAAGHLKTPSSITLNVYDANSHTSVVTKKNGATNYAYTAGQYLLVNAVHMSAASGLFSASQIMPYAGPSYTDENGRVCIDQKTDKDVKGSADDVGSGYLVEIVGVATSISGAQSKVWVNVDVDKHTITGTDYNDNNRFHLDAAGNDTNGSYTWFFDEKGNLIGDVKNATAHTYGVITSMWSSVNSADGTSKVLANVTYMDGTTETLTVGKVTVSTATAGNPYQTVAGTATQQGNGDTAMAFKTVDSVTYLCVNEAAATNKAADLDTNPANVNPGHGIIYDNLFQITTGSNGVSDFVEVAGNGASASSDDYKPLYNVKAEVKKGVVGTGTLKITDSTQFLIGSIVNGNYVFTTVTGYKNIVNYKDTKETDFVDVNGDGYAEYVYITAPAADSTGWHIFYADAKVVSDKTVDAPQMRYSKDTSTTTVYGWLDGVEGSVTIRNSNTTPYTSFVNDDNGHTLWFVKIVNGYVEEVDGARTDNKAVNDKTNNGYTAYQGGVALNNNANGMESTNILTGTYKDLSIIVLSGDKDNRKVSEGLYNIGGKDYTTDDKTVVIDGTMDDIKNEDATLIIVYDGRTDKNNLIAQMYVIDDAAGTEYDPGTGDPEYSATVSVNGIIAVSCETDDEIDVSSGTLKFTAKVAHGTEFNVVVSNKATSSSLTCTATAKKHLDDTTTAQDIYTVTITGITESIDVKLSPKTPVTAEAAPGAYDTAAGSGSGSAGDTAHAPIDGLNSLYSTAGINISSSGSKITVKINGNTLKDDRNAYQMKGGCFGKSLTDAKMAKDDIGYVGVTFKPGTDETFADFKVGETEYGAHTEAFDIYLPIAKWVGDATTGHMEVITGLNGTTRTVTYTLVKGDAATAYTWTIEFEVTGA